MSTFNTFSLPELVQQFSLPIQLQHKYAARRFWTSRPAYSSTLSSSWITVEFHVRSWIRKRLFWICPGKLQGGGERAQAMARDVTSGVQRLGTGLVQVYSHSRKNPGCLRLMRAHVAPILNRYLFLKDAHRICRARLHRTYRTSTRYQVLVIVCLFVVTTLLSRPGLTYYSPIHVHSLNPEF